MPKPPPSAIEPWEPIDSRSVYGCRLFDVRERRSRSPRTRKVHDIYVLEMGDWVNIVPITPERQVVMVRQYRHGIQDVTLEVPAGMVDASDPEPLVAARREMREETGYDSDVIEPLGSTHPNPAIQGNRCHTFVARDVVLRSAPRHEGTEYTEPVLVPLADVPGLIRDGAISHALAIVAFHYLFASETST